MTYTSLGAEDDQSHDGDHPEDEGDLAVGLEPLAEPDEDGHPDDDHVEQRLEGRGSDDGFCGSGYWRRYQNSETLYKGDHSGR